LHTVTQCYTLLNDRNICQWFLSIFLIFKILQATVFDIDSFYMMDMNIPSKDLLKHRKKLHGIMPSALPLNMTILEYISNLWECSKSDIISRVYSIVHSGFGIEVYSLSFIIDI
jgi:hypothetical protein